MNSNLHSSFFEKQLRIRRSWKRLFAMFLLLVVAAPRHCRAEIRKFDGVIAANATVIHYSKGYLVTPGYVDISGWKFTIASNDGSNNNKRALKGSAAVPPLVRFLDNNQTNTTKKQQDSSKGGGDKGSTSVDIAIFPLPNECSNTRKGCDWTDLGVGAKDPNPQEDSKEPGLRWCCSNDAIDFGFCQRRQLGRLIINSTLFFGFQRRILVPRTGPMEKQLHKGQGRFDFKNNTGSFVLVVANCNEQKGRNVQIDGNYIWKSVHGYLPGDIFGEMYFFSALTIIYLILMVWYGISMKIYEDDRIPIQKWILATIALGLLETFFRAGDLVVWNEDGWRFWFAMYTGILIGVLKGGLSRSLVLMVSLGWGVVRDSLDQMLRIQVLTALYAIFASLRDTMSKFRITENQILTEHEVQELVDIVTILTFIVAAIDVTFYMWILDALNGTMEYLENMNQTTKHQRYIRLRSILLFSILFAVAWAIFSVVNTLGDVRILEEQQLWVVNALMEINILAVLIGVSVLWRPAPNAKDFAYVMELPSGDGEEHELEMTATIPSALDDDDEEHVDVLDTRNGASLKMDSKFTLGDEDEDEEQDGRLNGNGKHGEMS